MDKLCLKNLLEGNREGTEVLCGQHQGQDPAPAKQTCSGGFPSSEDAEIGNGGWCAEAPRASSLRLVGRGLER